MLQIVETAFQHYCTLSKLFFFIPGLNSVRSDAARETVFLDLRGNDKNRAEERSKSEAVKRILHITRGRSQATELVLLAPAVTVGERRELWILPPFFFGLFFCL